MPNNKIRVFKSIVFAVVVMTFFVSRSSAQDFSDIVLERIEEVRDTPGFTELNLSQMQLDEIPPEVFSLTHLTRLDLYGNNLETLPPEIEQLTNLVHLDIAYNQITSLPAEIGNLEHLEILRIGDNQLDSLAPEIGNLSNLRELRAGNNQFMAIPRDLLALKNLRYIYLSGDKLFVPENLNSPDKVLRYAVNPGMFWNLYWIQYGVVPAIIGIFVIALMIRFVSVRRFVFGGGIGAGVAFLIMTGLVMLSSPLFPGPSAMFPGLLYLSCTPVLMGIGAIASGSWMIARGKSGQDNDRQKPEFTRY